jgi:hypothetical protein
MYVWRRALATAIDFNIRWPLTSGGNHAAGATLSARCFLLVNFSYLS